MRPVELAQDSTPGLYVIQHAVKILEDQDGYRADVIVVLQTTIPLRAVQNIDNSIELFLKSSVGSLVSVVEVPHNMNPYSVMQLNDDGSVKPFLEFDERKNLRQ